MTSIIAEFSEMTYTYPDGENPALKDINLSLKPGELLGVIGPSGAGKSSLAFSLSGFIPHFFRGTLSGKQSVLGKPIEETTLGELAGNVGLVVQNPFNQISGARYTVKEEIAFGLENLGVPRDEMLERVNKIIHLFKLNNLEDRSPYALSGGQQQRLALASIFAMEPELLILDEPTSQLDPVGTEEVFDAIKDLTTHQNTTIVLITHKLERLAEIATRVIVLLEGEIKLNGDPVKILTNPKMEEWGIGSTQFTQAARLAVDQNLIKLNVLPITLDQAKAAFQ